MENEEKEVVEAEDALQKITTTEKVLCALAYLGILFFLPILVNKDSKFSRFHSNQGFIMLGAHICFWIVRKVLALIFLWIPFLVWIPVVINILLSLGLFVLMIIGIINVCYEKTKTLPIIGNIHILDKD